MKLKLLLTTAAALLPAVLAHGGVTSYVINGQTWQGFQPYNTPVGQISLQREWDTYDPLYSVSDAHSKCNAPGTGPAQLNATVAAGSQIVAKWTQWPHAQGPVMVYMAKVGDTFADSDGNGLVWFKINELGLISGTVGNGQWGLGQIMSTLQYTVTIPQNLAPGHYLLRHELLAIHTANQPQFYMECAQLTVTGSGTGVPSGSYLASFPGTYSASDPSIDINIYSSAATTQTTYKVPGPPVWTG